ncbi:hypothetical protein [Aurantiacibacter sediminis]|uniref:Lipoprotein n=1 Tax=Aurantiacibacter sediminis TaxID=2793064 RepID=A0ABS0N509_9SPHN|nr:hypothetical protein [Aurantiacibacter sediminis]MBH5322870.1 hypothetical protein [Aurantiacibacter sediminis]
MRRILIVALCAPLTACATTYLEVPFPTYEYSGIDLLAGVSGRVELSDKCLLIYREGAEPGTPPANLVMPLGTRLQGSRITLPEENGGASFRLGETIRVQGGFHELDGTHSRSRNPGGCAGTSFTVNRLY